MANLPTLLAGYSKGTIDAVTNAIPHGHKLPAVVVSQSIPPGTQVKKGETVGVTILSPTDVDLGQVVIPNFEVPVAIRKNSVGDIIDIGKDDATVKVLENPADPANQQAYLAVVNQKLGTNFGAADINALLTLQRTYS